MKINQTKLEELRVRRGLTQKELAVKAGISRQWLSTVLLRRRATPEFAVKLADALGVPLTEIIEK